MLTIHSSAVVRRSVWLTTPAANALNNSNDAPAKATAVRPRDTVNISSQAVARSQNVQTLPANNPYADTIVNFMQTQLQKDQAEGANKQALAQRLAAGFEGFLQGYEDAYALLGGADALPAEVNDALAQTKQQVTDAVKQLAADFAIDIPAAAQRPTPAEDPSIQLQRALETLIGNTHTDNLAAQAASNLGQSALGQTRSLNLHLTTAEGDIIELIANNTSAAAFANSAHQLRGSSEQSHQWTLSIQGDLNDQELGAISDFIHQLDGLTEEFYQGDLAQAVNYAQAIGVDSAQISAFSLSLKQIDIRRIESAYNGPQAGDSEVKNPQQSRMHLLGQWLEQLDQLRSSSLSGALPAQWLQQISVQSLAQWYPQYEHENAFLNDFLSADRNLERLI